MDDQSERNLQIEEARRVLLQEQLADQLSIVESLKESLGVKTRLTEAESNQLKISREITRALNGQDTSLNSVAEKTKQIAKNKKLIEKTSVAEGILDNVKIQKASQYSQAIKEQSKKLDEMKAEQVRSGRLDDQAINSQKQLVELEESRLNKVLGMLSPMEQAAYYQKLSMDALIGANTERELELIALKKMEKSMGVTGALAEGLSKIPGLGNLTKSAAKVQQQLADIANKGQEIPGRWKTFGMMFKQLGTDVKDNLTDPLFLLGFGLKYLLDIFKKIDTATSETARNYGISNKAAMEMNSELTQQAATSNSTFQTTLNLVKAQNELNNRYGVTVKLNQESTRTYVELTKQAGLSAEAAGALYDTTVLTKKGFKETAEEQKGQVKILRATTGLMLNEKEIQEGIKNVSTATKLQLGGSVTAITNAVFQAKALGVELKTLESISSSLLNFQSSIEDELAAELLTGKQLNLEGARYAALIGDQAMLAEELAANFGTAADFQDMNVIQQEAMAKAVGLNRDSLAESLMKREAIAALSEFEGVNEKEKYENAVKLYGIDGARQRLGNDALADQMESVSMQERLVQAGEKFQQSLIPIVEKILPLIESGFKFLDSNLKGIVGTMGALIAAATAYKAIQLATAAIQITKAFVTNPITASTGLALASGALVGLAAYRAVGDVAMKGDGGPVITSPQLGGLRLNKRDDLMAGPGLIDDYNTLKKSRNTGVEQAIKNHVNITPSDTRITLNLNGQAIGNANARQAYGVGSNIKALGGGVDYSATV
jgi:hypothetical protein